MISIDISVFFQVINFLLLILILNFILYKPTLRVLDERGRRIAGAGEECRRLEADLSSRQAAYEARLMQAKIEATELRDGLVRKGTEEARVIMDQVTREVPKITAEFEKKITEELDRGRVTLRRESHRISQEIAEKTLGRSLE
ncbi:MAG: hypothetical protein U1C55_11835 [Smithellaceae bacterium]|nr:hypothetical protein [Smithellaceae bacterium]